MYAVLDKDKISNTEDSLVHISFNELSKDAFLTEDSCTRLFPDKKFNEVNNLLIQQTLLNQY